MMIRTAIAAVSLAALVPLGACSKVENGTAAEADNEAVDRTLAAVIADSPDLTSVSRAMSDAGLAGVFDGPGSYTVLAPDDDAFAKLGDGGKELTSDEGKPILVAVLRDHILPGHMTPKAIRDAIAQQDGSVEVTTLGDGAVTFTLDDDNLVVQGEDRTRARVDGTAQAASNGVVIPIDGVLKKPQPIGQ